MSFPSNVREHVLVACARHCCICHKFCGIKIELHHIVQKAEGGLDTIDNCIPLCFDCHGDMRSYDHKHPKGTKYTPNELKKHRDNWYDRVGNSSVYQYNERSRELDIEVTVRIKTLLPPSGSMSFIRTNNFAGFPYLRSRLDDLDKFMYEKNDPTFEYIDVELEGMRATLSGLIDKFLFSLATNTFVCNNVDYSSVPEEWEFEYPERFDKVVNEIHSMARQICSSYDDLVRASRRNLGA